MMLVAKNVSHDHVNGTGQLHGRTCILARPTLVAKQDSSWDSELERELTYKSHMLIIFVTYIPDSLLISGTRTTVR